MGNSFTVINLISLIATLAVFIGSVMLLTRRGKIDSIFLTLGSLMELGRSVFFTLFYRSFVSSGSFMSRSNLIEAVTWIGILGYLIFVTGFILLAVNLVNPANTNRPKY